MPEQRCNRHFRIIPWGDLVQPLESHNIMEFTLDSTAAGTHVTWNMHAQQFHQPDHDGICQHGQDGGPAV